jgi:hypothetical protein
MNLPDLTNALLATPVSDIYRNVKIVFVDADGFPSQSLGIARIAEIQEWVKMPDGRRQRQPVLAIIAESPEKP